MEETPQASTSSCFIKSNIGINTRIKPKKVMFIRGTNSNLMTTLLMKNFNRLKKPHSVFLKEKYDIKPFEDATTIEDLAKEQNCPLFMFSSHNKKRPNNIIIGRLSEKDKSMKDMIEFGIENLISMQEIKGTRLPVNSSLCLSFDGSYFQECNDYRLFKEMFCEFFEGHMRDNEKLSKVDYYVKLNCGREASQFECSRVLPRYKKSKVCKIEFQDLGPNFDFSIRRVKLFTSDVLMDIPEETPDDILVKPGPFETSTLDANTIDNNLITNNNNKSPLTNCDNVDLKTNQGIKRNHEDLNERLKRMKFLD